MTFKQLNKKLGGNEVAADWSQHANGGGWVNKTAKVDVTAFIGDDAIVWGAVYGNAWVYGNARVCGDARVYGNARVCGDARVCGNARVYGNARVCGDARVCGNAWESSPLFIIGTKHALTNAKHGHIQIGCRCEPFKWWLGKEALAFAKANGYTPAQIKEYRAYVKLFMAVGK